MKKLYTLVILIPFLGLSQVGVNTNTPLEELHISGNTSNVRVDGLNSPNNPANLGGTNSTKVFVDDDGDLTLGQVSSNIEMLFDPFNYLNDAEDTGGSDANVVNQTGTGSGYTIAGWPRQIGPGLSTFELTRPAIIEINYSLSWAVEKSGIPVDDQHARVVQSFLYLLRMPLTSHDPAFATSVVTTDLDGVPLTIGRALGINGQFFTSGTINSNNKFLYNTGTDYVKLPPGRYCPMFAAQLAVGNTGGTGAVKMFLGGGQDEVQIIAHYYN